MSIFMLLPLINEYGICPREDSWCEGGVQYAQLAYASYAALLAAFEVTSLLGVGARGRRKAKETCLLNCWPNGLKVGADIERKVALQYDRFVLRFVLSPEPSKCPLAIFRLLGVLSTVFKNLSHGRRRRSRFFQGFDVSFRSFQKQMVLAIF